MVQVLAASPAPAQIPSGPQSQDPTAQIRALQPPTEDDRAWLRRLPLALEQAPYRWFASTDAKHENNDFVLLKPGETRRVPLAAGNLERLWSTASEPGQLSLKLQYGAGKAANLVGEPGAKPLTDKTFLQYAQALSPADARSQIGAGAALVATNRAKVASKWFYQATVRPLATPQALQPTGPARVVNAQRLLKTNDSLGAVDMSGGLPSGYVDEVKITLKPATLETWNRCFVRGWPTQKPKSIGAISEQRSAPTEYNPKFAIEAPLLSLTGQFFGTGTKSDVASEFDGKTLTLRWPLPFSTPRDTPTLDVVNLSAGRVTVTVKATVRALSTPPPTIFHAHLGSGLTKKGAPLPIAKVKGAGAFVGMALGIRPTADSRRRAFAYLEGNELIKADASTYEGTGTEDFFNSAWYFPDKPFARPFGGVTWKQALPPQVAAHRWMVPDAVPFKDEFSFTLEHGNRNNADDLEYRWLACFYATPSSTWEVPDALNGNPDAGTDPQRDLDREAKVRGYVQLGLFGLLGAAAIVAILSLLRQKKTPSA